MAVAFVGAGSAVASADALSVSWPGSQSAGDIGLLLLETNETDTVSVSGWTELASSPQSNVPNVHKLSVFWKEAAGSDANVSIPDPGNHGIAQILVFSGVDTTAPVNVTVGTSPGVSRTSVTCTGVTTTADGCGVVHIVGTGRDANTTAHFDGWANANLASITEISDVTTGTASGGGFGAAWGIKTTAGATGDCTVTQAISSIYTAITVALEPAGGGASAVYSDLADSYAIRAAIASDLADASAIRAAASSDLSDSYFLRAAIAADLADSYSVRAAVLADLSDSFGISAAVAAELLDVYLIRATATTDLSDSYSIAAAISADLADSYEILSAGVVTSDLADSYTIRAAVSSDVADSYSIRAGIVSDLTDSYAIRAAVASDLSDTYAIIVSASTDIADSYVIRAAVAADLVDGYSIGDAVALPCPSAAEIADAVWSHASGADIAVKLSEAWGRLGLDPANPLISGQTEISFGAILMALTGNETASTLTRQ